MSCGPRSSARSTGSASLTGRAAAGTEGQRFPVTIAGPLCSGLDVFAAGRGHGGAGRRRPASPCSTSARTAATESMPFFLSHPLPPELVIEGGEARVARPRIEPETWLGWQS